MTIRSNESHTRDPHARVLPDHGGRESFPLPQPTMTIQHPRHTPAHRHLFILIGASLIVGFLLPIVLAIGPAGGGGESRMTGAALIGWATSWALIAALSRRFTVERQRWALVPAAIFGVTGIALIAFAPGTPVMDVLAWVWPGPVLVLAVWMILHVRRDVPGRSRWLLYPVVVALALLAVGGAAETVIEATDDGRSAFGGELVDVGGHRLFISCTGTGSPTVVLESGLGQGSAYWARIAPTVATTTRVCAYDRAGRGSSEPATGAMDGAAIARDLHALLAASGNAGPYVLVGHSSGGVYVRVFAAAYPDEVAGVVLLDAQSPHATSVLPMGQTAQSPISTLSGMLPALARVGLARLVVSVGSSDLPSEVEARRRAAESTPQGVSSFGDELLQLDGILAMASALPDLGDRPLVVVTAAAEPLDGWLAGQERLATLSTNVSHRVFPDLTHVSLIESAKGATAASDAIGAIVMSLRSGTRLDGSAASDQ
jgi:pimeloyl-ACP methyl ester carboxylesterase